MRLTLDTNVLARVLVDDPSAPEQCKAARKAVAGAKTLVVPQVVQVELCWLLESAFALTSAEVLHVLQSLRANPRVELEHPAIFDATVNRFCLAAGCGFADCMVAVVAAKQDSTLLTFDKKLARHLGITALRA